MKPSVSATPDPVPFGGTVTIAYQSDDPYPWAKVTCVIPDGSVGLVGWVDLSRGQDTCHIGSTPSWSGGPAECAVELFNVNTRTGTFGRARAKASFRVV